MLLYWSENGNNAIWFLCWWTCYLVNYRFESHFADNNSPSFPLWWAERGFISSSQWPPLGSFGHDHVFLSKSHFGAIASLLWLHRLSTLTQCRFCTAQNITELQFPLAFSLLCSSQRFCSLSFPASLTVVWKMKWKLLPHFSWMWPSFNQIFHFIRFNCLREAGGQLREYWEYGQLHLLKIACFS